MTALTPKAVHIVLGGGGIRCISYVGALAALAERGYTVASVSACSAGSMIGVLLCAGLSPKTIERLILETDLKRFESKRTLFSSLRVLFRWPHAIFRGSGASKIVREWLDADPKLMELSIPFATIGVDLVSNSFIIYSSKSESEMHVSEALSIATAVPFAYPPYQKGGRIVVDAAVATQCPIWLTALHETNLPIFAFTCRSERTVETPVNFADYLARIIEAGAESGDEAMFSMLPQLRRIEILCPTVNSLSFAVSSEMKRALLDAGHRTIRNATLEPAPPSSADKSDRSHDFTKSVINNYYREVIMNNNVNVGGNAIVNIDAMLNNVQQTLQQSAGLASEKKGELEKLVGELRTEIDKVKEDHAQEASLISRRLQDVVEGASQPEGKRNSGILNLSSKGLVEAAETVGKIAPKLLSTAGLIAKFVAGI